MATLLPLPILLTTVGHPGFRSLSVRGVYCAVSANGALATNSCRATLTAKSQPKPRTTFAKSCSPRTPTVAIGSFLSASATLRNVTRSTLTISAAVLRIRPPDGERLYGTSDDLSPDVTNVIVPAGESIIVSGRRQFSNSDRTGTWTCYLTFQTIDQVWHDDPAVTQFTVTPLTFAQPDAVMVSPTPTTEAVTVQPAAVVLPIQTTTSTPGPTPAASTGPAGFISASGTKLMYNGIEVRLRGENFNNEPGLACCGGPNIRGIDANGADYAKMHSLGANSIRLGLDYGWYQADRAGFYSAIDAQVEYARANHLWVILNLYTPPGGSSGGFQQYAMWGNQQNKDLLITFWNDVALHYSGSRTIAGYDLLNEPAPSSDQQWVDLSGRLYLAIRQVDANHLVVIEAPLSNDLGGFNLRDHVLYSVHHYAGGDNYPSGRPSNTPLWVGEFGQKSDGSAVQFVHSEIVRYEADGVSWCHFVEREASGFGLFGSYTAGDFSSPWTAMIAAVQAGFAGSVLP